MLEQKAPLYRKTQIYGFEHAVHTFAMDYYRPGSQGEDDFTRKEVWFYFLGDEDLQEEFQSGLASIMEDLFVKNSVDWDMATLAPSSSKAALHGNMQEIVQGATREVGMEYRQVLRRTRNVGEDSEIITNRERVLNLRDSMEVTADIDGENIVVINNVSVSGLDLAQCTDLLLKEGAERVCSVCLGVTNSDRAVERLGEGVTASGAIRESEMEDGDW